MTNRSFANHFLNVCHTTGAMTVAHPGADALTLPLIPKTGRFGESFTATAKGKALPFTGLMLQTPAGGFGQFHNTGKAGGVTLAGGASQRSRLRIPGETESAISL